MKKRILSILLCLTMVMGLLPTMAFAVDKTGNGTETVPYVFEVKTAAELSEAVAAINADTSDTSYYTISLQDDITTVSMSFNYNTTTILGNGKTLTLTGGNDHNIAVRGKNTTSKPVLILGESDNTDTLTLQGQKTNDCPPFFVVGNAADGTNCGTLKMYNGVTITGATGNNYYGGAVIVGSGGYFEMNGGTIEKCGIDGGSTCFGGGVAVINKGRFTMNGGSIQDCFLNTGYCDLRRDSNNLFYNYGAGAGVFVSNGAVFKMTGGEIKNNTIKAKDKESYKSYGVGGGIAVVGSMQNYNITARVEITGGAIEGNHATLGGGGIAVCGMKAIMYAIATTYNPDGSSGDATPGLFINGTENKPVQIIKNTTDGWYNYSVGGGGILLYRLNNTNQVQINNAVISGNTATNAPGGGIESLTWNAGYPINFSVENTALSGNNATEGGAICLYNASDTGVMKADFSKTIITANNAADIGGGISVENTPNNSAENTAVTFDENCAIYDNTASDVCSDDFYKYSHSTVTNLPTAEQMSKAANVNITGWYHDEEDSRYSEDNAVEYTPVDSTTDELQLKAVKKVQYIVTFDSQGGSEVTSQKVSPDGTVTEPDAPTYDGYEFAGWYTDKTCQTVYDFKTAVTSNMTLYAKWKQVVVNINIDVDVQDGTYNELTFSNLLSSETNKDKTVMVTDDQKSTLANAITDKDIKEIDKIGGVFGSIQLLCKVKDAENEKELDAAEKYISQNFPGYSKLSYDIAISKVITVDGREISNENIKELPDGIHIQFAVPDEWQNGTVKLLRTHTSTDGEVTVDVLSDAAASNKQIYEVVSDNFSTYTMIFKKSSSSGSSSSTNYYYFSIEKVDAQDNHTLNGAKFGLYLDGKQIATATSDRNGIATFSVNTSDYRKMTSESNLYYQELTAPEGYVLSSDKTAIKRSDLTTSQSAAEKKAEIVRNYRSSTPDLLNGDDHFAYVIGYEDGSVRPNGQISRAETATIFFRLLKDTVRDDNLLTDNSFADVKNDYWANTAISTMMGLGIVQGRSSTTFDPQASITRAEFAAICARFDTGTSSGSQTFSDISGHWAEKYIQRAAELGWIKGFTDGTFRPDTYITRAEAMTMINRVLNRIPEETSDLLSSMNVWPDCTTDDWFYLAVQEATNSHDYEHKVGNYETWIGMNANPDWTRYEN